MEPDATETLPPPPTAVRPPLRRTTDDRHLGGVAGGLAAYLGLDPMVVRVAFVAITILSLGFAVGAYLAGWVLLGDDTGADAPAIRWFREHGGGSGALVALVLMSVVAVAAIAQAADLVRRGNAVPWIIGVGIVGYLVTTRRTGTSPAPPPRAPTGPPAPTPAAPALAPPPPPAPLDPAIVLWRERRRAVRNVTVLTAFLVGLAGSVLWATGAFDLAGWVVPAAVLAVLVVGLAMAPFTGWSWSLAVLAVAVVPVLVLTLIPGVRLRPGVGYREANPATAAQVAPRYQVGIGEQIVDLSGLTGRPSQSVTIRVVVGMGTARVVVPADARVHVVGHVSVGSAEVYGTGRRVQGTDVGLDRTITPVVGELERRSPAIEVQATVGIGDIVVEQASP